MKFVPHSQADIAKVLEGKQGVFTPPLHVGFATLGRPQTEIKVGGETKPLKGPTKSVVLLIDPDNTEHKSFYDFARGLYEKGLEHILHAEKLDPEEASPAPFFLKKEKDKEGMPTGNYRWNLKKQVAGTRKDGSEWGPIKLAVVDAQGKPIPEATADTIGRRSVVRAAVAFRTYTFGDKYGVTADLDAVQVIDLVETGGGGAQFDAWEGEGGFTVGDSGESDSPFGDPTPAATSGGSDY
jgi:hypothetical protein